jgi:hypothetical protein
MNPVFLMRPGVCSWEEVDLFGRCLALQDPEWPHPGLLVLFLSRAAPVTTDKDAALAFPLMESALSSLGLFSPGRVSALVEDCDQRVSDYFWHFEKPNGWMLGQRDSWSQLGFSSWNQFVKDAEELTCASVNPEQFARARANVEKLALAIAETWHWDNALALADALEEADCRHVTVLAALRSRVPAQILWVLELLLGEPQGRLIRRHLGSPVRPVRTSTHRLEVQFPDMKDLHRQVIREFQQTLFDQGLGSTGGCGGLSWPLPGTTAKEAYATTLIGDTNAGLDAIRRVLAKYGPPADTAIFSWQEFRHLSLVPGSGLAPDPRGIGHEPDSFRSPRKSAPAALDLEVQSVLARLVTRPVWIRNEKGDYLTWIEYCVKDNQTLATQVMQWHPQTEQERDDCGRFYAASNWRSYEDLARLFKQPRQPGEYVVRSGLGGYYSYLAAPDDSFTNNVREALLLSHEQAILAVIRLTKEQQIRVAVNPILCWDLFRLDDAIVCHDRFARADSPQNSSAGPKDNAEAGLGFGAVADPGDASEWTKIAWGHYACLGWGSPGPDPVAAMRWYHQAADHGDALAQASLGFCDASGDLAGALRWYSRAADEGNAYAQCILGQMYKSARGVEQDYAKAVRLIRLSADAGHAEAQFELGLMYDFGYGVPKDTSEALRLWRLALDQGFLQAAEAVKLFLPSESELYLGRRPIGPGRPIKDV